MIRLAHDMHRGSGTDALEVGMKVQRDFLLLVTLSAMAAAPVVGQTAPSIPDFSGPWNHTSLNGLELPLSGPGPVRNRARLSTGPQAGGSCKEVRRDFVGR